MIYLCLKPCHDAMRGEEITIDHFPFVLGRQPDCDAQILHPLLSRHHCQILRRGWGIWLQDLESRHGTLVNATQIEEPVRLRQGDVITLPCGSYRVEMAAVQA